MHYHDEIYDAVNFSEPVLPGFKLDAAAPDFMVGPMVRAIARNVWADGCLRLLSSLDPEFFAARAAYLARKDRPWPIRMIK